MCVLGEGIENTTSCWSLGLDTTPVSFSVPKINDFPAIRPYISYSINVSPKYPLSC